MMKIAITGAPMSGKSYLLKKVKCELEMNYNIPTYILSEVASDLIENCFTPETNPISFQSMLYRVQKTKEEIFYDYLPDNGILLADRGLADGGCYISEEDFKQIMSECGDNIASVFSRYDHIIQLQTLCVFEDVKAIDTVSNINRLEKSKDDVLVFEKRLMDIYKSHPSYHFIYAQKDLQEKYETFLNLILTLYNSAK